MAGKRNVRDILFFVAISCGLAWLVALPLWKGDGLYDSRFGTIALAMMFTPALAALVMVFIVERPSSKLSALGIWPLRPTGRLLLFLGLGIIVPVALVLAALPIGAALGVYPADFENFSGFKMLLGAQLSVSGQSEPSLSIEVLIAFQFLNVLVGSAINLVPALGEELGWRGWLLPKLLRYGQVEAIVVSGLIWGVWHAPLILLGYNYPMAPGWLGIIMMTGMCILIGAVFGWLRLRSDSVWPAAMAHGTFNAAAGFFLVFAAAGAPINTVNATILGWSGWIVPLAAVIFMVSRGQFRRIPSEETRLRQLPTQPKASG